MPLADKIMELRKKQGWSQIDLADRLDVSRQSVSKWEMAQAVPELDKIIKMSELFAVTTDYLLKDDAPKPDPEPQPEQGPGPESGPQPEPETGPAPGPETPPGPVPAAETPAKPRRRKWPWVLAAVLLALFVVPLVLSATGIYIFREVKPAKATPAPLEQTTPAPDEVTDLPSGQTIATPSPSPATAFLENTAEDTVEEAPPAIEQMAVSDPDAVEDGMTEYVYEGESVTGGGFDQATLEAMAAEYAPYGLTYDEEHHHWYLDGQRIRVFTDVLTTNGESLTGGDFHGTLRTFSGDGFIDVRTVRDYDNCDDEGVGKLLYLESCDVRQDSAHWTEHHAEDHHDEDHHE